MPYRLLHQQGAARRGEFVTVHGTVQTPAFMNVATAAAIKGGLSAFDLKDIRAQVMLCNTYHLHLRPGDETVAALDAFLPFVDNWATCDLLNPRARSQSRTPPRR